MLLLCGSSGLIGGALQQSLDDDGVAYKRLVRREPCTDNEIEWNPAKPLSPTVLDGVQTVVHLGGRDVLGRPWTTRERGRLWQSRVDSTATLVHAMQQASRRPAAFLCASAIGIYGDRGEEILDEQSSPGGGFLAELCQAWEAAATAAEPLGVRVVRLRIGIVLSPGSRAWAAMSGPRRFGLSLGIGSGQQWMSWISLADAVRAIRHLAERADLSGPFNLVSPAPLRQRDVLLELAAQHGRTVHLRVPRWLAAAAGGDRIKETAISSARVLPGRLIRAGFAFRHETLAGVAMGS